MQEFKKYWPYIAVGTFLLILLVQECNRSNTRSDYRDELAKKDSIINIQKYLITTTKERIKQDSIEHEKEMLHIKTLRERYPDDFLLDSLFRAGQSVR